MNDKNTDPWIYSLSQNLNIHNMPDNITDLQRIPNKTVPTWLPHKKCGSCRLFKRYFNGKFQTVTWKIPNSHMGNS